MGGGMQKNGAATPTLPTPWSSELNFVMKACLSKETWDRPTADQVAAYAEAILKGEKPSTSIISRHANISQPIEMGSPQGYTEEVPVQEIYYDEEGNIDFDWHDKLGELAKMILYGGLLTAVLSVISFFVQLNETDLSALEKATYLVETALYVVLSIICYRAIKKRKPDAMFLSRCFLIYCFLSWFIGFFVSFSIIGIIVMVWCVIGIYWTYSSDDAKTVFPKGFRKITWKDIVGVACFFLIPFTMGWISGVQKNKPQPPIEVPAIEDQVAQPKQSKEDLVIPEVQPKDSKSSDPATKQTVQPKQETEKSVKKSDESQKKQEAKDDKASILRTALNAGDYKTVQTLANQGYAPAYGPLAKFYLNHNEYQSAETYANKAKAAGYPEGNQVIKSLEALGYYD